MNEQADETAAIVSQLTEAPDRGRQAATNDKKPRQCMSAANDAKVCAFCNQGAINRRTEELVFHQWTSRGYVLCRVMIPIGICDRCGARSWNEDAKAIVENAVRREYERLR